MCGIVGIKNYRNNEPVNRGLLLTMCHAIAHRGPDAEGIFIDGDVGFGHRRLSIIDLGGGNQPMSNARADIWIVFNGEIYNFIELRKELEAKGYKFRTRSDTEVIILMYEEYGEKAFARLNGIFAFAIYDKRNKSLIIVRDPFGVKPIYYYNNNGKFIFASEIKCFLEDTSVDRELDIQSLNSFLTLRYNPSPQTLFRNIQKLASGSYLKLDREGKVELRSYLEYRPRLNTRISEQDAIDEYSRLLEAAVKRQMVSDVPIGLFLSGGVDSAVIGYLMQKHSSGPINTFSIGFPGQGDFNELADAMKSAKFIGANHREMTISQKEYMDFFYRSFSYLEEPIAETTIPALYYVSKMASEQLKVVLAGQGADEPLAGYTRYIGADYINKFAPILSKLPIQIIASMLPRSERIKRTVYASRFSDEISRFMAIYAIFTQEQKRSLLKKEFLNESEDNGNFLLTQLYGNTNELKDSLSKLLYIDTRMSLSDDLLLFNDKMTMANSLEMRVPFLDIELVKFIESLPSSFKLRNGIRKYIHKKAALRWIPREIIYRKKRGFATPMDKWLQVGLSDTAREIINPRNSACSQYFNLKYINWMIEAHRNKKENFQKHIFMLLSFELWHQNFFKSGSAVGYPIYNGVNYDEPQQKRIIWFFNRFFLMNALEILYRIRQEIGKNFEKGTYKKLTRRIPEILKEPIWYYDLNQKQDLLSYFEDQPFKRETAEQLLEHKFSFFSFVNEALGDEIKWNVDYKNKKSSPLVFGKQIDYRKFDSFGNVKYIWELNRHQHLIPLAKVFYVTREGRYKEEALKQIDSWIDANPYMLGINWSSSLETAIRLISWSWVWHFLGEIEPGLKKRWVSSIYKHCYFISRNLSRFSSANNHLIGEAAGLFIASVVWDFGPNSQKWQDTSRDILVREILKQNYSDGVNKEQAVTYQQFVLDFFLLAALLGERNGVKFPESYWKRIEKMLEYIASIMDVSGNVPNIGDSDDGFAVILACGENFNPYKSLLATGAVIFGRGDFKAKAGEFDEKSLWLLGEAGRKKFNLEIASSRLGGTRNDGEAAAPRNDYPEGGYYILSYRRNTKDEIVCIFDCGPLGYLSLAAHGHADALSFTLSVGGDEFLIDPGTYAYHTQKEWRNYFRGTHAHNTIVVDGLDQSVIGGNFMWLKKTNSRILRFEDTTDESVVVGEHDGYARLKVAVTHEREIRFDKSIAEILIIDRINGKGSHEIEQNFHFDKDCLVEKIAPNRFEVLKNGRRIILQVDEKLSPVLLKGSLEPICGWQSKKFDVKEPCFTLVNNGKILGSSAFKTTIFSLFENLNG